ncbi:hypothetical protein SAMN05880582_104215 [Rhizobium sp. RU20A]|uniref:hypothetical protein n=1 Tax=Rhizobium sp. RU20A TaxID=1907412 RepID=UPI000955D8BB|nr:hypothetical protein [Rhizobium sp. RU20A]SIQ89742.1 hypothetical protein SAMN05880582_104215 [Rhizobium sp. RU20A]
MQDIRTPHQDLADQYLALGGRRQAIIDDNKVSVRQWDDEPQEADAFWRDNVDGLDDEGRREVALLLPSVSDEAERKA